MKRLLPPLIAVALAVAAGCKKNQTVEGPVMEPAGDPAVATGSGPVEVIDVDPAIADGYAHDVVEDVAAATSDRYEVRRGDTLWSIAMNLYGDGKRWRDIADANRISDPQKLRVGQSLVIP